MFLFVFPLKYRLFTLRFMIFTILCLIVHLCACSTLFIYPAIVPLRSFRTVQEFKEDHSLKIIEGCTLLLDGDLESMYLINLVERMAPFTATAHIVYFAVIPILMQFINVIMLTIVLRKHIKTMSVLMQETKNVGVVNYIRLLKVTILLGISFLLQELPPGIFQIIVANDRYMANVTKMNSTYLLYVSVSFAVTKPLDIIIYASQSKVFRRELLKIFKR
jgi:hypothetical protein